VRQVMLHLHTAGQDVNGSIQHPSAKSILLPPGAAGSIRE
jgi:hypothetical protein